MQLTIINITLSVALLSVGLDSAATDYYVDSINGNDRNDGLSIGTPWQTLRKVNNHTFLAGDQILLKRNSQWYDASIKVKARRLSIKAYGQGNTPELIGATQAKRWRKSSNGTFYTYVKPKVDISLVHQKPSIFYKKTEKDPSDLSYGEYVLNKKNKTIHIKPTEEIDPNNAQFLIGSQNSVIELQEKPEIELSIDGVAINFSNRFGIAQWWQGQTISYGNISIENCTFKGNTFSAIALSGKAHWETIFINNNIISHNGAEGIYIGPAAAQQALTISNNIIGTPDDLSFGWFGEGPNSPFNGDGIDVKYDNKNVLITNNWVSNVKGRHGITSQSTGSIISRNIVTNTYLPGALDTAGISVDIQSASKTNEPSNPTYITDNIVYSTLSHGIASRGNTSLDAPIVITKNTVDLEMNNGFAQYAFPSMNNTNIALRENNGNGGSYGIYLFGERPKNFVIENNEINNTDFTFFITPRVDTGIKVSKNIICNNRQGFIQWKDKKVEKNLDNTNRILGHNSILRQQGRC